MNFLNYRPTSIDTIIVIKHKLLNQTNVGHNQCWLVTEKILSYQPIIDYLSIIYYFFRKPIDNLPTWYMLFNEFPRLLWVGYWILNI
jgi:hypothetical protein